MIVTTIPLTLSLSLAIGAYMLAAGIALLRAEANAQAILDEFERSTALRMLAGVVAFSIGVAIVLAHRAWIDLLAAVVSLVGWIAVIEGLLLIAAPDVVFGIGRALFRAGPVRAVAVATLLIGAILFLLGLLGRAG